MICCSCLSYSEMLFSFLRMLCASMCHVCAKKLLFMCSCFLNCFLKNHDCPTGYMCLGVATAGTIWTKCIKGRQTRFDKNLSWADMFRFRFKFHVLRIFPEMLLFVVCWMCLDLHRFFSGTSVFLHVDFTDHHPRFAELAIRALEQTVGRLKSCGGPNSASKKPKKQRWESCVSCMGFISPFFGGGFALCFSCFLGQLVGCCFAFLWEMMGFLILVQNQETTEIS